MIDYNKFQGKLLEFKNAIEKHDNIYIIDVDTYHKSEYKSNPCLVISHINTKIKLVYDMGDYNVYVVTRNNTSILKENVNIIVFADFIIDFFFAILRLETE